MGLLVSALYFYLLSLLLTITWLYTSNWPVQYSYSASHCLAAWRCEASLCCLISCNRAGLH